MGKIECMICGSDTWKDLPNPNDYRSVTTASRIVNQPLGKSQCMTCGFVQRIKIEFLGKSDYYEQNYATYYEKVGTNEFHKKRYTDIVSRMKVYLNDEHHFNRIIDIGCGQGGVMEAVHAIYPDSVIEGIDPSSFNAGVAIQKGYTIYEGKLEHLGLQPNSYDLVYSNNVIQHVNDARDFILRAKDLVSEDGVIIITCPNGSVPSVEILWSDQNFSFLPLNLLELSKDLGFETNFLFASGNSLSLPPNLLLLLTNNKNYRNLTTNKEQLVVPLEELFRKRTEYISSIREISKFLDEVTSQAGDVYNFGASYWTSVLAAYCPEYWDRVTACVVDSNVGSSKFLGKDILQTSAIDSGKKGTIVIGTNPGTQEKLRERFGNEWKQVVTWDSYIKY